MSGTAPQERSAACARRRAVLVGEGGGPLVELLSDVLADVGVALSVDDGDAPPASGRGARPDLVLVVVDRNDIPGLLGRARAVASGAPVIAILPFHDERLERQVLASGADGLYSLDTPIERLKSGSFAGGPAT